MKFRGSFSTIAVVAILVGVCATASNAAAATGTVFKNTTLKVKAIKGVDSSGHPLASNVLVRPTDPSEQILFRREISPVGSVFPEGAFSVSDINPLRPTGRCGQAVEAGAVVNPNRVICEFKRVREILVYTNYGNDNVEVDRSISLPARISTSRGIDSVRGGGGDDSINTSSGSELDVFGGGGSDRIRLGQGDDGAPQRAYGDAGPGYPVPVSEGDDDLTGGGDFSELYGEGGDDSLRAGSDGSLMVGGAGFDRFSGRGGNDTIDAREDPAFADDYVSCGSGEDTYLSDLGIDPVAPFDCEL